MATDIFQKAATLENQLITGGLSVRTETVSRASLTELAAKAPNLWRMPVMDEYRIVTIEGCTPIPCGGTHVRNASEAKGFHFVKVEQLADSFRVYFDLA